MKRSWFSRHPICFMALYLLFYLSAFNFLETRISMPHLVLVHCRLDDLIPFCKYAIIPYSLWFPWIPFTLFFVLYKGTRADFWRLCLPLLRRPASALDAPRRCGAVRVDHAFHHAAKAAQRH